MGALVAFVKDDIPYLMSIKQLVGNLAAGVLVREFEGLGAKPLRADDRDETARLRAITPLVVPRDLPWRSLEDRELLLSGLRLAAGQAT